MVRARIENGAVQPEDMIPAAWEGQTVKIVLCTPDDSLPNLANDLAALHAMGPMEFEPGERVAIDQALAEMDERSRLHMGPFTDAAP